MLVLPSKIHDLGHLGLGNLIGINATDSDTAAMHVEHDASRLLPALVEEPFENMNDELHRSVIVIQHQDLVHRGLFGLRLGLDDYACTRPFFPALSVVAHFGPIRYRLTDSCPSGRVTQ